MIIIIIIIIIIIVIIIIIIIIIIVIVIIIIIIIIIIIKSAVKIYSNNDKKIEMVRRFEEKSEASGRRSLVKDAKKYAGELDFHLNLVHPVPTGAKGDRNEEIEGTNIGVWVKRAQQGKNADELRAERWQGKFVVQRWEDKESGTELRMNV